jgi:hypothetical protein
MLRSLRGQAHKFDNLAESNLACVQPKRASPRRWTSSFDNFVRLHQDRRDVRPSARAVLRLAIGSKIEGCSARSAGLVPFSTLSTMTAAWRKMSSVLAESEIKPPADILPRDPCTEIEIRHATTFNRAHSQLVTRLLDQMLSAATWSAWKED